MHMYIDAAGGSGTGHSKNATSFSLLLPEKILHFNALNEKKKIRRQRKQGRS